MRAALLKQRCLGIVDLAELGTPADAKFGKERIDKRYMTGLIFKAFKLHRDGAHVKALRIRTEGDSPERDIFVL